MAPDCECESLTKPDLITTAFAHGSRDYRRHQPMEPLTRRVAIHFYTHQVDECLNFYRDLLGFKVVKDMNMANGTRWAVVAKPDNLGVQLHFHTLLSTSTPPARFEFSCVDVVDACSRLREAGIAVTEWEVPYAEGCRVYDPIGNEITLSWWGDADDDAGLYPEHIA